MNGKATPRALFLRVLMWVAALVVLGSTASAWASSGNEIVLIVDNSGSMAGPFRGPGGKMVPGNDPDRAAALGALILSGLTWGTDDHLTVLAFGDTPKGAPVVVDSASLPSAAAAAEAIRAMPYANGTFYRPALQRAREVLDRSTKDGRLLMFLTDGAPSDMDDPSDGPALLGLPQGRFGTLILGLFGSEESRRLGEPFLRPLARVQDDLVFLAGPRDIVPAFTRGYARMLGARPVTGTMTQGSKPVEVGKYVLEVLVMTASSEPGAPFEATLTGPKGSVAVRAGGDNGCDFRLPDAPGICAPPRRHYRVFRQTNDPDNPSHWQLSIPKAPGAVEYGIILRYDLVAKVVLPPVVRAEEPAELAAELLFHGRTFVDEEFFRSDGFEAQAVVEGTAVPLKHEGRGRFVGQWVPPSSLVGSGAIVRVTFKNTWMERTAEGTTRVEGVSKLDLSVTPNPVDLGVWKASRSQVKRCAELSLVGSTNADRVALTCASQAPTRDVGVSCEPVAGSEAKLPSGEKGQPMRWQVCVVSTRCCGPVRSSPPDGVSVTLSGKDPRYASSAVRVPVLFRVEGMSWLACWWPLLAALGAALFVLWVIVGLVRPHSFEPSVSIRVAGSEPGLRRTSALVLRELPGGVRGFYRNARIALNATGDFVKAPRLAVLVVEAGPAGTTVFRKAAGLERKNRRTGGWEPVPPEEFSQGFVPGSIYRLGSLVLKFE